METWILGQSSIRTMRILVLQKINIVYISQANKQYYYTLHSLSVFSLDKSLCKLNAQCRIPITILLCQFRLFATGKLLDQIWTLYAYVTNRQGR